MRTVLEVSQMTGVSIRALHHYDALGLLRPRRAPGSGYRLYSEEDLERLQMILLFRTLEFPLQEIGEILDSPGFDRKKALEQQVRLLQLRKEHIESLIALARGIQLIGVKTLDFSAFDTSKMDAYAAQAKASWGKTEAYREFEEKSKGRSREEDAQLAQRMMAIFDALGALRNEAPESAAVQEQIAALRGFITENYYACTPEILRGLGEMYAGGGSMTENIDRAGGEGTAAFARLAILAYCQNNK